LVPACYWVFLLLHLGRFPLMSVLVAFYTLTSPSMWGQWWCDLCRTSLSSQTHISWLPNGLHRVPSHIWKVHWSNNAHLSIQVWLTSLPIQSVLSRVMHYIHPSMALCQVLGGNSVPWAIWILEVVQRCLPISSPHCKCKFQQKWPWMDLALPIPFLTFVCHSHAEQILQWAIPMILSWVKHGAQHIQNYLTTTHKHTVIHTQDIRNFFQPKQNPEWWPP